MERVRSFSQGRESSLTAQRSIMRNWSQRRPISLGIGNAPRRSSIVIADTAGKLGSDRSNSSRQLSLHSEPSCRAFRPGNRDPTDRYDTYNNFVRSCRDRNPIDFAWRETVSDETVCHSFRIFPFDLMGDLVGFSMRVTDLFANGASRRFHWSTKFTIFI